MATSKTDICNMALLKVAGNRITGFDSPEDSVEWQLCQEFYDPVRDAVLEAGEWSFATVRVNIAPLVDPLVFGGDGSLFPKPADNIRILTVNDNLQNGSIHRQEQARGWEIEGENIIAPTEIAHVRYTKRITDPSKYSANFVQALVARLGSEFAVPIAESKTLKGDLWAEYIQKLDHAYVTDGKQGRTRKMRARQLTGRR